MLWLQPTIFHFCALELFICQVTWRQYIQIQYSKSQLFFYNLKFLTDYSLIYSTLYRNSSDERLFFSFSWCWCNNCKKNSFHNLECQVWPLSICWLIDWCLAPTIAIFQLYRGVLYFFHIKNSRSNITKILSNFFYFVATYFHWGNLNCQQKYS